MGKRKSSPRLATTSRLDVVTFSMVQKRKHYTLKIEKRDVVFLYVNVLKISSIDIKDYGRIMKDAK
ncbi:hypothetical protein SAMN05877753_10737 [Bacillus oleivorans]|uniref:Uncharacterized protein n=1 Tax=Bacillus oleivorans TaxID=1448271 RepID=A0A285D2D8_9BACI|nr:hypothetical protein SAMN05877753_10737 [Bacillus oleivorans]